MSASSSKKTTECIDLTGYSSDIAPPPLKPKVKPPQPKPKPEVQIALPPKVKPVQKVMKQLPSSKKKKKLEAFNEMPLDILQEICSHLHPISLLSLTLTAKKFRNYLTSSTSNQIWINAREKLGLPTLKVKQEDMNEIQYAHFIWNRNCTLCRVKVTPNREVNFECRILLCDRCQFQNIVPTNSKDMQKRLLMGLHPWALVFTPEYTRGQTYILGIEKLAKAYEARGITRNEAALGARGKFADIYYVVHADYLLRVADIGALTKWRIAEKEKEEKEKAEVLRKIADGRKQALLEIAIAVGWTEAYFTQVLLNEKVIKKAIATTQGQWGNWIVKIEIFLEDLRKDQSAIAAAEAIADRRMMLKPMYQAMVSAGNYDTRTYQYLPMHVWIELPIVSSLWQYPLRANHDPTDLRRELWPTINTQVLEYESKIKLAIFRSLLESHTSAHLNYSSIVSIPPAIFDHDSPTNIEMDSYFNEPTSLINCQKCLKSTTYPEILRHICLDPKLDQDDFKSPWEEFVKEEEGEELEYWNVIGNGLRTPVEGVVAAFVMLKAYEKEISDVAPKERLSSLSDRVFTCVTCSDSHDLDRLSVSETMCHFIKYKHFLEPWKESDGREVRLLGPRRLIELVYGNDHLY